MLGRPNEQVYGNTGSRYMTGTVGGMSELSYSISEAGTQAHMAASGMSNNFMA